MRPDPQPVPVKPQLPVSLPILNAGLRRVLELRSKPSAESQIVSSDVPEDSTKEDETVESDEDNVQQGNREK